MTNVKNIVPFTNEAIDTFPSHFNFFPIQYVYACPLKLKTYWMGMEP